MTALGDGQSDPFQMHLAYPQRGLAVGFVDDTVATLRLTAPVP